MSSPSLSTANPVTANLGYPRIGRHRELKFALEDFWRGRLSETDLLATAKTLRQRNWQLQKDAGLGVIPSNDFSFYDQVLDALVLVGATPSRFGAGPVTLTRYFQMARNSNEQTAMEMTKWFDTNYHYLVPEWSDDLAFTPDSTKLLAEFAEAKSLGIVTRPVLIGPVTLLLLGKAAHGTDPLDLLPRLLTAYRKVLSELAAAGAEWVQIDEAALVTDLPEGYAEAFRTAYAKLASVPLKLMLTTYFGELGDNLELACSLVPLVCILMLSERRDRLPKWWSSCSRIKRSALAASMAVISGLQTSLHCRASLLRLRRRSVRNGCSLRRPAHCCTFLMTLPMKASSIRVCLAGSALRSRRWKSWYSLRRDLKLPLQPLRRTAVATTTVLRQRAAPTRSFANDSQRWPKEPSGANRLTNCVSLCNGKNLAFLCCRRRRSVLFRRRRRFANSVLHIRKALFQTQSTTIF